MHPETTSLPADRAWAARLNQWRLYAAAGGAAVAAGTAEAQIIYVNPATKPTASLPGAAPYNAVGTFVKNFTVGGIAASLGANRYPSGTGVVRGKVGLGLIGPLASSARSAKRFAAGQAIAIGAGSGRSGLGFLKSVFSNGLGGVDQRGQFNNNATGIAGFQLPAAQGGGFGWIRYSVDDRDNNGYPDQLRAINWAYNAAGGGITAGQTAVPEPTSLALLSLGAAGVLAWRRQRATTPAAAA